ncbi:winged helix DNA-binding protein [Thioalkalivibrio sp. ALE16]|uniref:winged helix DNA-binding protein n=1 Tax=Thioalkalivibrio sp. ALE16 TaxID=1158172 RepID=UPI0009DBEBF6|nr:winged helix DNA-binding protein [Thioalkalivibrio sp. ALE16]
MTWNQLAAWARRQSTETSGRSRITDRIIDTMVSRGRPLGASDIARILNMDLLQTRDAMRRLDRQGWIERKGKRPTRELVYTVTPSGKRREGRGGYRR